MVKTRQNDYQNESLASVYVKREAARRAQRDDLHPYECNGSDSSEYTCLRKRRRHLRMMPSSKYTRSADKRISASDVSTSPVRTRKSSRTREVKDENVVENGYDVENDHPVLMEDKNQDDSMNGIRRSTRRRKTLYDTLNQSWILGAKIRDFSNIEKRVLRESEKMARKQEMMDDDDDDNSADEDYADMYSRVKRKRRNRILGYQSLRSNKKVLEMGDGSSNEGDTEENAEEQVDELAPASSPHVPDEEPQWDSKSSESEEIQDGVQHPKYYLRQKKPTINRFQFPIDPPRNRKVTSKSAFHLSPAHHKGHFRSFRSPAHRNPFQRRHATHNSSSSSSDSSSSSSEDERRFERRKSKSMVRARNRCLPMNFANGDVATGVLADRAKVGSSLADVDPMNIDRTISFDNVGGLRKHVDALKEMVVFPLLYPEVFEKFKITPPRGVLFFGPPGTGKTLVARALANECSQGEKRIAFFMRKGADCLSKWVGESERQLRLLFDQAFVMRPSIIFFDEIDGLAPVRSSRQDQIHSSIVSTLLALMDGLDNRGEVVVIGATNRVDAIDPALRRPGRFDREFNFPLPSLEDRCSILQIHTKEWIPKLKFCFLNEIAKKTIGYCGADLKALCGEVGLLALKRRYPQIYKSRQKLLLDVSSIQVEAKDFFNAMLKLVPASQRSATSVGHPLCVHMQPLLQSMLSRALKALREIFPTGFSGRKAGVNSSDGENESDEESNYYNIYEAENNTAPQLTAQDNSSCKSMYSSSAITSHRPRVLLTGKADQGQSTHLAPALLYHLEHLPVHKLDLPTLYAVTAKAPEEACSQVFSEAHRTLPGILYLPHLDQWWEMLSDTVRATFLTLLHDVEPGASLLLLATSNCSYGDLPDEVKKIFSRFQGEVVEMQHPTKEERREFFALIFQHVYYPPKEKNKTGQLATEELPLAPSHEPRVLSPAELKVLEEQEECTLRELRLFLRQILYKLARDRRFTIFNKPVDITEVPDYLDVIKRPMDLEAMLTKIDMHQYETVCQFLEDIDLICHNALEYNPDRDPSDKLIRHRACALRDSAHALIDSELDPDFEKMCQEIVESRKRRGFEPNKFAPKNYHTNPQAKQTTNLDSPARNSTPDNESDPNHPKRFSRRLRGMSVGSPPPPTDSDNKKIPHEEKVKSPRASSASSPDIIVRRKPSLWFGKSRRYVIRRSRNPVSSDSPSKSSVDESPPKRRRVSNDQSSRRQLYENALSDDARNSQTSNVSSLTENEQLEENSKPKEEPEKLLDDQKEDLKQVVVKESSSSPEQQEMSDEHSVQKDTCANVISESQEADAEHTLLSILSRVDGDSTIPVEAVELQEPVTDAQPASEPRKVTVDEDHVNRLINSVVNATERSSIESLERLNYSLRRSIAQHRKEWDKSVLLELLERQINAFRNFPNS